MKLILLLCVLFIIQMCSVNCQKKKKEKVPKVYNHTKPSSRYDNPANARDRTKMAKYRYAPAHFINRLKQPYHPAWMDWCDPYHCNDYHKLACGLNRYTMRFQWFQSGCHMIIHNMCTTYRGSLSKFSLRLLSGIGVTDIKVTQPVYIFVYLCKLIAFCISLFLSFCNTLFPSFCMSSFFISLFSGFLNLFPSVFPYLSLRHSISA